MSAVRLTPDQAKRLLRRIDKKKAPPEPTKKRKKRKKVDRRRCFHCGGYPCAIELGLYGKELVDEVYCSNTCLEEAKCR